MPKSNSMRGRGKAGPAKPKDPFPDFPLGASTAGWWVKRIRGKLHYFGPWYKVRNGQIERLPDDGWQAALELYNAQKEDLHAGRIPRVKKIGGEGLTVGELRGRFLTAKSRALDAGEITRSTYFEYRQIADLLMAAFGEKRPVDDLAADDFSALRADLAKRWGPIRLGNGIVRVKSIFKYAFEQGLIDKPMRYGAEFKPPSASVKRRHRAKNGERMIEADEIRRLLDAADPALRAMVLLGVNCGFNNKDCADLPLKALDLKAGWLDFPRPKTGVKRRCPLWPETVEALRAATAARPEPREPDAEPLVFVTTRGRPWLSHGQANPVSVTARDAMKAVGIHHEGIGFATLRHVFRTVADGCRDQVAINHIMGHSDPTMGAVYRERIDDSRLRAVADYVRRRVWPDRVQ